jgi:hypothetical protein
MELSADIMLVPYGTDSWSVEALGIRRFTDRAVRFDAPFPCAAINKRGREPLRLNSETFKIDPNDQAKQGAAPLLLVRDHLKSFCRAWDRLSADFIDGYFAHIARMLDLRPDEIERKMAPFVGLYTVEDWAFSAPKPLPRAFLYAPRDASSAWSTDDFLQVDFALWLGDRMVAALSQTSNLTPSKARERFARLEQAGVGVVPFAVADIERDPDALFERIIGDFGALLQSAGPVPVGPFRPRILGE